MWKPPSSTSKRLRSSIRLPTTIAVLVLWSVFSPVSEAQAQQLDSMTEPPASYSQALAMLDRGDTTAALQALRRATAEAPSFGPAFLRLGSILSARASEVETDFEERLEARRALERARELMGDDPEVLLEYGLLLRKQGMRTDARRVLDRAWRAARRAGEDLPPRTRARLHYSLARIYESWWEDWQNLVMFPENERVHLGCANIGLAICGPPSVAHAMFAVYCPARWWSQTSRLPALADLKSDERARMIQHFTLAYEADSTLVDAAVRLLGHLADASRWDEYTSLAQKLVRSAGVDARPHLFLGLGLHESGREDEASVAFERGLSLLPPAERHVFDDVGLLLPAGVREDYADLDSAGRAATERLVFTAKDPLFLTEAEERRLEHYARLAWAELKFSDPTLGMRGWESERGAIWVRYGRPEKEVQCCYGGGPGAGIMRPAERPPVNPKTDDLKCIEPPRTVASGTRFLTWSYGENGPNFSFSRRLTYRKALFLEPAKELADALDRRGPELYRPRTVATLHSLPHQAVRFRGERPELTRMEVYAQPPVDSLNAGPGDSLHAGVFVFTSEYERLWERRGHALVGARRMGLTYAFELPAGEYVYALEARRAGPDTLARPLARERVQVSLTGFPAGRLAVSDLLLATALLPLTERPTRRYDLRIWPSRTLEYPAGAPVGVYFEVYGLEMDDEGLASYRVELSVEGADERNLVDRVARGLVELFSRGGDDEPRVSWERTVPVDGDRAIDYISVELPQLDTGAYTMRILITDLGSGETAETTRGFRVQASDDG